MSIELSSTDGTKMAAFFTAFSKAQAEINNVLANTQGHNYKYAELSQVLAVIREPFAKNGLAIMQFPFSAKNEDGTTSTNLSTIITHESGEWIRSSLNIDYSSNNKTSAIQQLGGHITYARRYMAAAIAGVAQVDDENELLTEEAAPANKKIEKKKANENTIKEGIEAMNKAETAESLNKIYSWFKRQPLSEDQAKEAENAYQGRLKDVS